MDRPLRIFHINSERGWRGGEQQTIYLMQGLRERGHENFLIAPPNSAILERSSASLCTGLPLPMRNEWDLLSAIRLARWIRSHRPDVLHAHTARAHTIAWTARFLARANVPLVVSRRMDYPIHTHRLGHLKYSQADAYIAVSQLIAGILRDAGIPNRRIRMIHDGVDSERPRRSDAEAIRQEFGIEPSTLVIGTVGVCEDRKSQRTLIEALPPLLQIHPKVHAFILGDGPLRPSLTDLAEQLGIIRNVHFPGFRNDVDNFLKLFDIFVLSPKMEGLGSSILEAQCFALPVVATSVGGIPEIVQDGINGILIPPGDSQALAQALRRLIEDSSLRAAYGHSGFTRVMQHFTLDRMSQNTLEVYRDVLRSDLLTRL